MAQAQPKAKTHAVRDWPFAILPLHPVLGCEITGITLEQAVSPELFAKVYEAFLEYQLIVFRDVDLPPATQVAFARNFLQMPLQIFRSASLRKRIVRAGHERRISHRKRVLAIFREYCSTTWNDG